MTELTPDRRSPENVNDESATLVAWSVPEGERVTAGQPVAQVETSKAVVDLPAPSAASSVRQTLAGEDVPIGAVLGWIVAVGAESPPIPPPRPEASPAARSNADRDRTGATNGSLNFPLAPSVRRIVAEEKINPARVQGTGRGGPSDQGRLLGPHLPPPRRSGHPGPRATRFSQKARADPPTARAERARLRGAWAGPVLRCSPASPAVQAAAEPTSPAPPARPRPVAATGVKTRSEQLPRAKRTEARYLRSGFEMTLPSVVTVTCPTRGFHEAAARSSIAGNATAIIVFEAARLLRKYPAFNAYHGARSTITRT